MRDSEQSSGMNYLQRYLVDEMIEDYREGQLSRRQMMHRVLLITGSIPATASLLLAAGCGSTSAPASAPTSAAATASGAPISAATATIVPVVAQPTAAPTAPTGTGQATAAPAATSGTPSTSAATSPTPTGITVSPTDPAIDAEPVQFPGKVGTLFGYRSAPKGEAKAPGILVIHENKGLTEHIKDVTRRYARDGYLAVSVDLVSRQGGTDKQSSQDDVVGILGKANPADLVQDLLSGVTYLMNLPAFAGPKAGVVGYCFGGGLTWLLAIQSADLAAAIPYYGPPPPNVDDLQKVTAAVLAFYGGKDTRITSNEPKLQAAMEKYHKTFEYKIYPDAAHAFNNDTGPSYNAADAKDAYARALSWFATYLKT